MKNPSRLLALLLAGSLGLTSTVGAMKFDPKRGTIKGTIPEKQVEVSAVAAAAVAAGIIGGMIGAIVSKARLNNEVRNLRKQFPMYPIYALELAATAKLVGFRRFVHVVAMQNIAKFRNPFKEIRVLAMDRRVVNAISHVTNYKHEYIQRVLANPRLLQVLNPF